ncbi:MAG: SAM-dependent methyltransferase [Verrucomicrobiota bacterium]|nr:SAM-dependent methyltransferase [Verrucomicrobiota bacterium]
MIWEEFRTPPKFGCELPGPKGPGFRRPDESLSHEAMLAPAIGEAVRSLQGLIAESEKSARRYLRRFLSHDDMTKTPLRLLNEHTQSLGELLEPLERGECWGLISDAGLPCLADPGADLVWQARSRGVTIQALPGPSSIVLALQLSGLSGQRFSFHGYLPREGPDLERKIIELEKRSRAESASQIFIEAPYRSAKLLDLLVQTLQPATRLCVAVNLTTPNERVISQSVEQWKKRKVELGKEPAVFLFQ